MRFTDGGLNIDYYGLDNCEKLLFVKINRDGFVDVRGLSETNLAKLSLAKLSGFAGEDTVFVCEDFKLDAKLEDSSEMVNYREYGVRARFTFSFLKGMQFDSNRIKEMLNLKAYAFLIFRQMDGNYLVLSIIYGGAIASFDLFQLCYNAERSKFTFIALRPLDGSSDSIILGSTSMVEILRYNLSDVTDNLITSLQFKISFSKQKEDKLLQV